jgi:hypothetical protein
MQSINVKKIHSWGNWQKESPLLCGDGFGWGMIKGGGHLDLCSSMSKNRNRPASPNNPNDRVGLAYAIQNKNATNVDKSASTSHDLLDDLGGNDISVSTPCTTVNPCL